jgi:hypothetical protein
MHALESVSSSFLHKRILTDIFKGTLIIDGISENDAKCAFIIGLGDGTIAFLACCIPDLKLEACSIHINRFDLKVYTDGSNIAGFKLVLTESYEYVRLTYACVTNNYYL